MPKKNNKNKSKKRPNGVPLAQGRAYVATVGRDEFVLEREEYLREVISTSATALDVVSIPLNPAQAGSAPAGSRVGAAFEQYEVEECTILFNSGSAGTAAGKVFMKIDLDPTDSAPASKSELLTGPKHMRCSDNVFRNQELVVPKHVLRAKGALYCRPGTVPSGSDQKLYDWGTLHLGNLGTSGTDVNLGDLIIKYRYRLRYPELSYADQALAETAHVVGSGSVSDTAIYGTAATVTGGLDVDAASDTLTFNRLGEFIVGIHLTGTACTSVVDTSTATVTEMMLAGSAASQCLHLLSVVVTEVGQTCVVDASGSTAVTASEAWIGTFAAAQV